VGDWDGIRVTFHSEHRPLEAIRESSASASDQRWQRIPLFLHVRAVKLTNRLLRLPRIERGPPGIVGLPVDLERPAVTYVRLEL
jgi:hypothetical protein